MNPPRPHHTTAQVMDILPMDVSVEAVGGLVDLYLDTNDVVYQRVRLTADLACALYRDLAAHLPVRLPKDATDDRTD